MSESGRRSSGGCLRAGLIGCGVLLVLAVIAVIGVATNLDLIKQSDWFGSISQGAESAKVEFQRSLEIRAALLSEYPADEVGVHIDYSRSGGVSVRVLTVSFESPTFEIPESRAEQEELARGIARAVTRLHPEIGIYDRVGVRIVRRFGGATVSTSAEEFVFLVDELVAAGAETGAGTGAGKEIEEGIAPELERAEGE